MCGRGRGDLCREKGCVSERYRALQDGSTPLHLAAWQDRVEVLGQLLDSLADKEAKDEVGGDRGRGVRIEWD